MKSETKYYYAIRVTSKDYHPYLARQNPSAPSLFWFHEDAVKHLKKCGKGCDIVRVVVTWNPMGKTYNTPGDMFLSGEELKMVKRVVDMGSITH